MGKVLNNTGVFPSMQPFYMAAQLQQEKNKNKIMYTAFFIFTKFCSFLAM